MSDSKKDLFSVGFLPAIYFLSQKAISVDLKSFVVGVIAEVIFKFNWKDNIEDSRDRVALLI